MPRTLDYSKPRNWTHNQLLAVKPTDKRFDVYSDRFPGLRLRVYPTGRTTWIVDYRYQGKRKTLTLATFPKLTHAKAAEEATKAFAYNPDPAAAKAQLKAKAKRDQAKKTTGTLRDKQIFAEAAKGNF